MIAQAKFQINKCARSRASDYGPPHADILKLRAIALAQLGRLEEARAQVRALLTLRPDMTIAKVRKRDFCLPDVEMRTESLRLAGLPE